MLYIYGDSHAKFSFKNTMIPHINYHHPSITMFRIGRDNMIVNYNSHEHDTNNTICCVYGEIDCRCHIQRQIDIGKDEDEVIEDLVSSYFTTLYNSIRVYKQVIVTGVIPPTRQIDYEVVHGPIMHEFPFVGTDESRVRYTKKVNIMIDKLCNQYGYLYFNPYKYYERADGTLQYEYSDGTVHLGNNSFLLEQFVKLYDTI